MEMYINSPAADRVVTVPFSDPATLQVVDVTAYQDNVAVFEFPNVVTTAEELSVTIPMFLNQFDGVLEIKWVITYIEPANGQPYTVSKVVPVHMVTPILPLAEIKAIDPVVFATDSEVHRIEKAVRHIIQAYTGQEFGYFYGTQVVKGIGGTALFLPRRLLGLESVNGVTAGPDYQVDPDGYIVRYYPYGVPPVKADYFGLHMHTGGVIHNPNNVKLQNWSSQTHVLKGWWGFKSVPAPVQEAARLLINDYACADSQYRDRYLVSMTAADWRIQFNSGAFLRTGNVRADQLLSEFVITRGWGVI